MGSGRDMVYRFSWLAAAAALILALARLQWLLRPAAEGPPWQLALVAAAVLGAVLTWALLSYGRGLASVVVVNLVGFGLAAARIAAPETTRLLLPTPDTLVRLGAELSFAYGILRHGTAPVLPVAGLIVISAGIFWLLGALMVVGLLSGRPWLAMAPPVLFYLQLSVIDHQFSTRRWQLFLLLILGGALAATIADEQRGRAGTLRRLPERGRLSGWQPWPAVASVALLALGTLTVAGPAGALVPQAGALSWRSNQGLGGGYYGGVSYNPFVGIRQDLVSQSDEPVFIARVQGEIDHSRLYWQLITLDTFDGASWYAGELGAVVPTPGRPWEDPDYRFHGPTDRVVQDITIQALRMEWLPALYSPTELRSTAEVLQQGFRVRTYDAGLRFDALSYPGLAYRVTSTVPDPDLQVLATFGTDRLSPIFQQASAEGIVSLRPVDEPPERQNPDDLDRLLQLPEELEPQIRVLARRQTANAATDFERGVLLEAWFRDPAHFAYSTDIRPGHSAGALADWLLDPESPNYHVGYCEQFATAMAVMARAIGIPSRTVLGFAPGDRQPDGTIVVRDRHAHAWVELWMPTQGWVRFDPTPRSAGDNPARIDDLTFDPREFSSLPPDATNPAGLANTPAEMQDFTDPGATPDALAPFTDVGPRFDLSPGPVAFSLLAVAGLSSLLPLYKWVRRRRRLARLDRGDVTAAWEEIVGRLADLGTAAEPGATPREFASHLPPLGPLASVYGEAIYGPERPIGAEKLRVAKQALEAAELRISQHHPRMRRVVAAYRLDSLRRPPA